MMISLSAQMPWGDRQGLISFWGDHAMAHATIASRLGASFTGAAQLTQEFGEGVLVTPRIFDVADQGALAAWAEIMSLAKGGEDAPSVPPVLREWLEAHQALHVAELQAMNQSAIFDLSVMDVRDERQFSDWMDTHARLHDTENQALGI